MFKRGPIPPFVHGLLDYAFAALLIAAPFLLDVRRGRGHRPVDRHGRRRAAARRIHAWTTGIVKSIPVVAHAMLDYALAALLIAMPFLLGFSDDGTASAFFVVCGVLAILLAVATRFVPDDRKVASAGDRGSPRAPRSSAG